jgi:hypothetical protein
VTATSADNAIPDAVGSPFSSNYFTFQGISTTATIALLSGGAFTLESLDISLGEFSLSTSTDITFDGLLVAGGTLNATFTNISSVQNVVLDWTGLESVTISGTDDPGIDNVVVVPEPSSALLLGLGAMGFLAMRRRRNK